MISSLTDRPSQLIDTRPSGCFFPARAYLLGSGSVRNVVFFPAHEWVACMGMGPPRIRGARVFHQCRLSLSSSLFFFPIGYDMRRIYLDCRVRANRQKGRYGHAKIKITQFLHCIFAIVRIRLVCRATERHSPTPVRRIHLAFTSMPPFVNRPASVPPSCSSVHITTPRHSRTCKGQFEWRF